MRTQVFDVTVPECCDHKWSFEFATETAGVYGTDADPVQVLCQDATGVPMLLNLNNVHGLQPITIVNGPLQNIWFDAVTLNT